MDPGPPLRDIGCFVTVAEHLSFSRAARELSLSQPAVSQAVARLEATLGLRLFERTSREVRLTDAGKNLLPHAESLLEQASAFATEAARLMAPTGSIRLAYCPLVGTLAARVARRLARRSPEVDLDLRAAGWSAATGDLARGTVSAAFMSTPFPPGCAATAHVHIPIRHVAVPASSALATASRLTLDQLPAADLLLPRSSPPGSVWAHLSARLPRPVASRAAVEELDDLPAALDLVAAGRGLLPAPQLLVAMVRRPDIRFVPLDAGGVRMTYALVWPREGTSARVMALVLAAQDVLRHQSGGDGR
jgi:DNA-binding transcriptional LysR family regulator